MLALAAVGGVWLISFALVAVNTGLAILLLARSMAVRAAGAAGVAVALAAGPVAFALSAAVPPVRHITVALVQPGLTSGKNQRVDASLRLSGRLRAARPDLIVWGRAASAPTSSASRCYSGRSGGWPRAAAPRCW